MNREAFLAAIRANPDDDAARLVFADWLDEGGEARAAARYRWWCRVRPRLREGIRLEAGSLDRQALGRALTRADHWRWRLGSLEAVRAAEAFHNPNLEPAPWPAGWSADRFGVALHDSRQVIEAVALGALSARRLAAARRIATEAVAAARGLEDACVPNISTNMGAWFQAVEVLHMAKRTVALTKSRDAWECEMKGEGTLAGELMAATASAFEILLAESPPREEN